MEAKRNQLHTSEKVCAVLSQFSIDPEICDHSGKKPTDGKPKSDKRIQILQEAAQRFKSAEKQPKSGKSKRKRLRKKAKEKESAQSDPKPEEAWEFDENPEDMPESVDAKPIPKTLSTVAFADNPILVSVKATLELILSHKDDYFRAPAIATSMVIQTPTLEAASKTAEHSHPLPQPDKCNTSRKAVSPEPTNLASAEHESSDDEVPIKRLLPDFDDLPWEVECPEKVVKFFKDKRTPHWLRQQTVEKIRVKISWKW